MVALGVLVEDARRKRFQLRGRASSDSTNFIRRSSLGLRSSYSLQQRSARSDESFAGAFREANAQMKSSNKRQSREGRPELHTEVYGSKKSWMMFNWRKLCWKASDQEDCAVCLESFKVGDTLIHLPCVHKFHCSCLEPWLQNNSRCPYCRTSIFVSY